MRFLLLILSAALVSAEIHHQNASVSANVGLGNKYNVDSGSKKYGRGDSKDVEKILDSLERGLDYFARNVHNLNVDSVGIIRMIEGQLSELLRNRPSMPSRIERRVLELRSLAKRSADSGKVFVHISMPEYSRMLGRFMDEPRRRLWYRSLAVGEAAEPVPCALSVFDTDVTDACFSTLVGQTSEENLDVDLFQRLFNLTSVKPHREKRGSSACEVTRECSDLMIRPRLRGYLLTHQMLFWQLYEMMGCVDEVSEGLRTRICSDVMRDAQEISDARFPKDMQDLFVEQVSLCGMWGFRDFAKPEWLRTIFSWQQPDGCFNGKPITKYCIENLQPDRERNKRNEKVLDGDCLLHKGSLALMAMTENLRFLTE